jgi:CheY-like chemotaxis protein
MSQTTDTACVLVVDDESSIRDTLVDVIEAIGCSAITAADGVEALTVLQTRRPCLVILDLIMPQLSGLDTLAEIRKRPELADLSVVISTSAPHLAPRDVPVLPKPINIVAMWNYIRQSCDCREAGALDS